MEEQIACFNREILSEYLGQSKVFYDESLWHRILNNLQYIPRRLVEGDCRYKQLVVYILIKAKDLYLAYRRTEKAGEKRLRYRYSIGIGGHVNLLDQAQSTSSGRKQADLISRAMWRELEEEIEINCNLLNEPELICFINDDSEDVGKVHFGVVFLLKIEEPAISKKGEEGIGELKFWNLSDLKAKKSCFERWSRLLIEYLVKIKEK